MKTQKPDKGTILVTDDKLENLDVLIKYLENFGFRFLVARSGEEMLKRVNQIKPDIILLDIRMPGMDGFEACAALKKNEAFRDIPVIFMTALAETSEKVKGLESGAVDYITKPFQQEEVLARIRTHMTIQKLKKNLENRNEQLQESLKRETHLREREQKMVKDLQMNLSLSLPHELRNPLNSILGFSELLLTLDFSSDREKINEFAREILHAGHRLHRLVENMLLYAKLEMLKYTSEQSSGLPDKHSLNIKRAVISEVRLCPGLEERKEDLIFDMTDSGVKISSENLGKIIREVIGNAFKFSKEGTPVRVTNKIEDDKCIISIIDRGCGMSQEQIDNIRGFLQFDRKIHEQQGMGLGLIIAQLLTRLAGGEFSIESQPDHGTSITLAFDYEPKISEIVDTVSSYWFDTPLSDISFCSDRQKDILESDSQSVRNDTDKKTTILVIDRAWENRAAIVKILSPFNMDVIEASNYFDGLQKAVIHHPKLAFLEIKDLTAPLIAILRSISAKTRIIGIASGDLTPEQEAELHYIFQKILFTPLNPEAILERAGVGTGTTD